jgi:hypothetical protein
MTEQSSKKFQELMADEAFVKGMIALKEPEDVQKYLADAGVEASIDEIKALGDIVSGLISGEVSKEEVELFFGAKEKERSGEELTEDELEAVAGGSFWKKLAAAATIAVSGPIGWAATAGVAIYDAVEGPEVSYDPIAEQKQSHTVMDDVIDFLSSW